MSPLSRRELLRSFGETIVLSPVIQAMSVMANPQDRLQQLSDVDLQKRIRFGYGKSEPSIIVDGENQRMWYFHRAKEPKESYIISTGKNGFGNKPGTGKTPTGAHRVWKKYGAGAPLGRIFKGRQDTGRNATIYTEPIDVEEDYITTRILWLRGLEEGINANNHLRYIYIHGTPEEDLLGTPASHGCLRMRNKDIISLYEKTPLDTLVTIIP